MTWYNTSKYSESSHIVSERSVMRIDSEHRQGNLVNDSRYKWICIGGWNELHRQPMAPSEARSESLGRGAIDSGP